MKEEESDRPDPSLGFLVGNAGRLMASRLGERFRESDTPVTKEQWPVLKLLWEQNGRNQQELAGGCMKDKTSVTRIIDQLEKSGLVVRVPDQQDRRNKLIYLTQPGRDLESVLNEQAAKVIQEATAGVEPSELEACMRVLQQISRNLDS